MPKCKIKNPTKKGRIFYYPVKTKEYKAVFCSWHYRNLFGGIGLSYDFTDCRRKCNLYRLKDITAVSPAPTADNKTFTSLFNGNQLQSLDILFNVGPLKNMAGIVQSPFQFFSQDQRQKAAEHVAPDILIALMVYRSGFNYRCPHMT